MKKYIVRLDDACPTMEHPKWRTIEAILDKHSIKPIVAVIPNNKDSALQSREADPSFWHTVQRWQQKGWFIALHGCDHVYVTQHSGLISINNRSEFAGLPIEKQKEKLTKGLKIFEQHQIAADIWVAPSHSFDHSTLDALRITTNIRIISDGLAYLPYTEKGFLWIPQQLWKLKEKRSGIWTCCFHPNMMLAHDFQAVDDFCSRHSKDFVDNLYDFEQEFKNRRKSFQDRILHIWVVAKHKTARHQIYKSTIGRIKNGFKG